MGEAPHARRGAYGAVILLSSGDVLRAPLLAPLAAMGRSDPERDAVLVAEGVVALLLRELEAEGPVKDATVEHARAFYRAALSAASQQFNGRKGTIIVVTDLQENGWDAGDRAVVPDGTTIEVVDVGAMPPNLSVTAIRALNDRVVATIHNAGPRARDAKVHLAIDDRPPATVTIPLGPNQTGEATFAGAPRGRRNLRHRNDRRRPMFVVEYGVCAAARGLARLCGGSNLR